MACIIGYLRTDINASDLPSQLDQLRAAGATRIIQEQALGLKQSRPQLDKLLKDVHNGDTVIVTSLDRIAHSTRHLLEIIDALDVTGVTLRVLDKAIDTSTFHGKMLRMILNATTEFERQIARERQKEGIEVAKRLGRYKGRKPTAMAKADEVLNLNAQGLTRQKIADQLEIGVASVYRILRAKKAPKSGSKSLSTKPDLKQKRLERKAKAISETGQLSMF